MTIARIRCLLLASGVALKVLVVSAQATTLPERDYTDQLRGLRWIVLQTGMDGDEATCKIDWQEVRSRFLLPIRAYTKLELVSSLDQPVHAFVIIAITLIDTGRACAYGVNIEVTTFADAKLKYRDGLDRQTIELWEGGQFGLTSKGAEAILSSVEALAKRFASDWQKSNP